MRTWLADTLKDAIAEGLASRLIRRLCLRHADRSIGIAMSPLFRVAALCLSAALLAAVAPAVAATGAPSRATEAASVPLKARPTSFVATKKPAARPAKPVNGTLDSDRIKALTAEAYVWGLAPEFIYRFSNYQELVTAPANTLAYGAYEAAWNNAASNGGDASVLYLSAMVDFNKSGNEPLVLTVPPSVDQYYVVNLIDGFINGMGSIGTRTTPTTETTQYLLVSPTSKYAHKTRVRIGGHTFRVLASDTNVNDILIRVRANSLVPDSDPTSVPNVSMNVVQKFALNTLSAFAGNGFAPVYPPSFDPYVPTPQQVSDAAAFSSAPTNAADFFAQMGQGLVESPLPTPRTALSGTPLRMLPSWVIPQYGAKQTYMVPAFGQKRTLERFASIGLTAAGWTQPSNWGPDQLAAFEAGFQAGVDGLAAASAKGTASPSTNYWTYVNDMIGTYPNSAVGYLTRGIVVLQGGFANVPQDAVYPVINTTDGTTTLDGNNTYSITFTPPEASYPSSALPVEGIFPPMVTYTSGPSAGDVRGFWSIVVYQPDTKSSSAPFIPQSSVLNTSYSDPTSTSVVSITGNTLTVNAPAMGPILISTPLVFGANAATYGLTPGVVYYAATQPVKSGSTYSFQVSTQWVQDLSPGLVPIQQSGTVGGHPGSIATLTASASPSLTFGLVQPVSQLGSQQITAASLARNGDGSITIWLSPTLPDGVSPSNWIPTPSTAYYDSIYGPGSGVNTGIEAMIRMYYPTPGNNPPSILPYTPKRKSQPSLSTSYVLPPLVQVP